MTPEFWKGRRVLVTGHTGFKGAWLSLLLHELGARVTGIALPPESDHGIFRAAGVDSLTASHLCDIADATTLTQLVHAAQPEVVLHLAAQPLVRESYREPGRTFQTNVMGTVNLLEALRQVGTAACILVITTDKVYENPENGQAFQESDRLGGSDPYSASKSCTEVVVNAWRQSFFSRSAPEQQVMIATARAGNVIGGGDCSAERLLPDILAAFERRQSVEIRQPHSIRPWQHVLEPLSGYLRYIEHLYHLTNAPSAAGSDPFKDSNDDSASHLASDVEAGPTALNFGPGLPGHCTVEQVVSVAAEAWGQGASYHINPDAVGDYHEAGLLRLDCTLAARTLGWTPTWTVEQSVSQVVSWRRAQMSGECMRQWSLAEIRDFQDASSVAKAEDK